MRLRPGRSGAVECGSGQELQRATRVTVAQLEGLAGDASVE